MTKSVTDREHLLQKVMQFLPKVDRDDLYFDDTYEHFFVLVHIERRLRVNAVKQLQY